MPSAAYRAYQAQRRRADLLSVQAGPLRTKAEVEKKAVLLHASLAAHVAAWDSYVRQVVKEAYLAIQSPAQPAYFSLHRLAEQKMLAAAKKLNTPNSDNTRNFMMDWSGFDPWPAWTGVKFGTANLSSVLIVRERLDEIFKVRHSFSHGFLMPAFVWNQDASGNTCLDCRILKNVSSFFAQLTAKSDAAYAMDISTSFGIRRPW